MPVGIDGRPVRMALFRIDADEGPLISNLALFSDIRDTDRAFESVDIV